MQNRALQMVEHTFAEIVEDYNLLQDRASKLDQVLTTINARQKMEVESRAKVSQRLETLLEILPGGVIVVDLNGVVVQSNTAAALILGISDLVNKNWSDIIASSCCPKHDDGLEVSLHNGKLVSVATNPLPSELGQIILITDVTKTRELQAEINQQKKLTAMGGMMSSLAHQVKTPLAAALIYISHVCNKNISSEQKELFASRVKERLENLDNLLQSMLMYVKGYIPATQKLAVTEIFAKLADAATDLITEHKMQLILCNVVGEKYFFGNDSSFLSALINLITNSVQASGVGANICVLAKMYDANTLDIIVSDRGVGISEENLPKVLQAFFTTKTTGTGLGLSVAQTVANSCNGKIWIKSSREQGTKVGIRVPCTNSNGRDEDNT